MTQTLSSWSGMGHQNSNCSGQNPEASAQVTKGSPARPGEGTEAVTGGPRSQWEPAATQARPIPAAWAERGRSSPRLRQALAGAGGGGRRLQHQHAGEGSQVREVGAETTDPRVGCCVLSPRAILGDSRSGFWARRCGTLASRSSSKAWERFRQPLYYFF